MQQFKAGIYMYIRGRFVHCKFRNEKKVRQILTHSDNVDVSMSPLPGNPVPPQVWCSTPLSRREEQAEPAVLPGP